RSLQRLSRFLQLLYVSYERFQFLFISRKWGHKRPSLMHSRYVSGHRLFVKRLALSVHTLENIDNRIDPIGRMATTTSEHKDIPSGHYLIFRRDFVYGRVRRML